MVHWVGLDVSLKETHSCLLDRTGAVVSRGRKATQPDLSVQAITHHEWYGMTSGSVNIIHT
jgi:hypothetical protein